MNSVVTSTANHDQILSSVRSTVDVSMPVVQLQKPRVLSRPQVATPAADLACIVVAGVNFSLHFHRNIPQMLKLQRLLSLQHVLTRLEVWPACITSRHRIPQFSSKLTGSPCPLSLTSGYISQFFRGHNFAHVLLEKFKKLRSRAALFLPNIRSDIPPMRRLSVRLASNQAILIRLQVIR